MRRMKWAALIGAPLLLAALFAPGIPHVFATGAPNWGIYYRTDLAPYSAACSTGAGTDVSTAINSAIADASNAGNQRGRVIIPPCATSIGNEPWGSPGGEFYGLSAPIVPKSFVEIDMWGAYFKWIGASTGQYMMANPCVVDQPLQHFSTNGGEFDGSTTANVHGVKLDSWQWSQINDLGIRNVNGNANRNGFQIGFRLTQGCGTSWPNHTTGDTVHNLHITSANIAVQIDGGVTNDSFYALRTDDITRTHVLVNGDTDSVRFYDYTFGNSTSPGTVNDGSWFIAINLNSTVGHPVGGYIFDNGSAGGSTLTANTTALNCAAQCNTVIFRGFQEDGTQFTQLITGEANFLSYYFELLNLPWVPASNGGYITVLTKGMLTPGAIVPNGYAQVTANQTGITSTLVDLTGLTVTVNLYGSQRICIDAQVQFSSSTASDGAQLQIAEGSTVYGKVYRLTSPVSGRTELHTVAVILVPIGGTHTYKLQMRKASGAGTITMLADNGTTYAPAFIRVMECGT